MENVSRYKIPVTINELREKVKQVNSFRQLLAVCGVSTGNTGRKTKIYRQVLIENNIDFSHFRRVNGITPGHNTKKTWQQILVKRDRTNGNRETSRVLCRALIDYGREYKCEKCGLTNWNDQFLRLEVNHIDCDYKNNEPENLEFLCPNCHSQYTYKDSKIPQWLLPKKPKNIYNQYNLKRLKLSDRLSKNRLIELLDSTPIVGIARLYNVSDNAVWKLIKKYGLKHRTKRRGEWQKLVYCNST